MRQQIQPRGRAIGFAPASGELVSRTSTPRVAGESPSAAVCDRRLEGPRAPGLRARTPHHRPGHRPFEQAAREWVRLRSEVLTDLEQRRILERVSRLLTKL